MAERIFIGVAWPYANGPLHLGHIAGAYLPADIFARFHRTKGNQVLMVSGSDQHGTPITLRADQEGVSPQEIVDRFHPQFLRDWERLGISWDLYSTTGTENHRETVQEIFLNLLEKGYLSQESMVLPYCSQDRRYLPDRYVNGVCPHCGFTGARGDQCDNCGKPVNPEELVEPRCALCGTTPEFRQREHFMLRLSAFTDRLLEWLKDKTFWRQSVINFTTQFVTQGLRDRAITRDISWGVPVPVEEYEDRRIYVWFEAVIGYLSASKEWARNRGTPELWRDYWEKECRSYYFIGKDNIPFHTIIWPAMLMGYGGLNLPYDVPANEFLTLEGQQFSTSRNWAVWLSDYLDRYDSDSLRYCLAATMPETSDSDFSWREFVRRNNNELVGTYGNLVHRVLTMTQRHFQGQMPNPGASLDPRSQELVAWSEESLHEADGYLSACRFRAALNVNMGLAREVNRYLEEKAPWQTAQEAREETARTLHTAVVAISALRTLMYPFLPFSSQRLHETLGFSDTVQDGGWALRPPAVGQQMRPPKALFAKLDEEEMVQGETNRLGTLKGR